MKMLVVVFRIMSPVEGGSVALRNVGTLPYHYTASQLRRPGDGQNYKRLENNT
jgi:hypothetical protein